ncbi:MAG: hypothetical protein ACAF41_28180 [Leptolyngbya sp. BL-A-14]
MTIAVLALPAQAQAQQFNGIQPIKLTAQQKAEFQQINQQFQTQYDQILTPEQFHLRELVKQNPNDQRAVAAFLKSLSPQQKQSLRDLFAQLDQRANAIYTPEQEKQFQHNINVRIDELKAERKLPSTYHYGPWQPIARINPNQATQLEVVNKTNVPLQCGLTTGATHPLLPGLSADLNDISLPANVLIYSPVPGTSLEYDVKTLANTAIVEVQQVNGDTPGDGSVAINRTGAIYIY